MNYVLKQASGRLYLKIILVTVLCAFFVSGCSGNEEVNKSTEIRTITDMTGRTVFLPVAVTRVASNGGAIDEWFLLLGAQEKMVSTSTRTKMNPWYEKIYPGIKNIAPTFHNSSVNLEKLLKARPDVVLVLSGIEAQEKLAEVGIPLVVLERRNPRELKAGITLAGKVLGSAEARSAAEFCAYYDENIHRITERTASLSREERKKVYLGGGPDALRTEGKHSLVTSWIEIAGGINVAAQAGISGIGRQVSAEAVIKWNPDVIILTERAAKEEVLQSGRWRDINAVKNGRVYVNPRGIYLWSVRSAEEALQILWAAKMIHPELFSDLDMVEEVRKFHKKFYKYDLTADEAGRMLLALPPDSKG